MTFTVVICPGAWPLVSFFDPLTGAFEKRGHATICKIPHSYPPFSAGTPSTLNPDSEYLRTHVLEPAVETGADLVIFMHSYGGVYGAESLKGLSKQEREAKGLKGGIIAAVLTAAFIAPTGKTALDCMGLSGDGLPDWIEYEESTGSVVMSKEYAKEVLFNDLPKDEAERLASLLPKQSLACFTTPVHWDPYEDPYFKGKVGFIYTGADRIYPIEAQRMAVAQAGIEHTYLLEGSSHSPHLEQPDRLADLVIEMVEGIANIGKK